MFHKCLIKSLLASLGMSQPLTHVEDIQQDKDILKKKKRTWRDSMLNTVLSWGTLEIEFLREGVHDS